MSGDSSGRGPESRGRGRDPHRDRTRSRSRSRSPLSSRGAGPERPSLEEGEPSDSGDEMVDPATLEAETDLGLCRQIRHQYRELINSVQRKTVPRAAGRVRRGRRQVRPRPGSRALAAAQPAFVYSVPAPAWWPAPRKTWVKSTQI